MPERILIPLDGSKLGEAALHHLEKLIVSLSPKEKMEVTLLHVIYPYPSSRPVTIEGVGTHNIPFSDEEMERFKEEATVYLDQVGEGLRKLGVTVKTKVLLSERGETSAAKIIEAEDEINADLVAMSTHGRRGPSRWAFGSVTEKVLRAGKVPVLVVRPGKET